MNVLRLLWNHKLKKRYVTKGLIYRKFPMGGFSTWLYYLFLKIFVYCIIIVQIANKVGCKKIYIYRK
jgi:hypothetical protein